MHEKTHDPLVWKDADHPLSQLPTWTADRPPASIHLIPSLDLGGAEKFVIDLLSPEYCAQSPVIGFVLSPRKNTSHTLEHVGRNFQKLIFLSMFSRKSRLDFVCQVARKYHLPIYCHLISVEDTRYLQQNGVATIPVIHNTSSGWKANTAEKFQDRQNPFIVACSQTIAQTIIAAGATRPVRVLRHRPVIHNSLSTKEARSALGIPEDAMVIGMIGRMAPQKNYTRAARILREVRRTHPDAILVIIGDTSTPSHARCLQALCATAISLDLCIGTDIVITGGLPDASQYLQAFNVFLNTSLWEGLSMACTEARISRIPAVISNVGGQSEIDPCVTVLDLAEPDRIWAETLIRKSAETPAPDHSEHVGKALAMQWPWMAFFAQMKKSHLRSNHVLFLTLDLNTGGAQKSLCNLLPELPAEGITPTLAITGRIGVPDYLAPLDDIQVINLRGNQTRNITLAERVNRICTLIARYRYDTVCFWHLDAATKALIANILAPSPIKTVDVSPGPKFYAEMTADLTQINRGTGITPRAYLASLDALVEKYRPAHIINETRTYTIPNGVRIPSPHIPRPKTNPWKVAVCGRLTPSKYPERLPQIAKSLARLAKERNLPCPEIHVYGGFHRWHTHIMENFEKSMPDEMPENLIFHGPTNKPKSRIADAACLLMLSEDQGCPNASLEAMSVGVPVIANNTGGVPEQVINEKTGILLPEIPPDADSIATEILRICSDPQLRNTLGKNAREHATKTFSMSLMARRYAKLFQTLHTTQKNEKTS